MGCSASKVTDLSGAFCQPCVHGRTMAKLERAKGFEPSTPTLARSCSTTELHPHPRWRRTRAVNGKRMTNADRECNRRDALRCRAGLRFYQQMAANRSETAPRRSLAAAYREPGLVTRFGL